MGEPLHMEGVLTFFYTHMQDYQSQAHVSWTCTYHIVIVPKYRKKVLYGQVKTSMGQILKTLCKQKGIDLVEGHLMPDHVHMVLSIPPKYSVADVLGFLKGKSAIKIHYEFSKKRKLLQQKSFWTRGYFVRTTGLDTQTVIEYVKNQLKLDQQIDNGQMELKWD